MRSAPCVLGENLSTVQKLAKGTKEILESLVWEPKDCNAQVHELSTLLWGKLSHVPQPRYIIIRVEGRLLPVE